MYIYTYIYIHIYLASALTQCVIQAVRTLHSLCLGVMCMRWARNKR